MKERSKYVLEGALVELVHNEYDRLLSVDELMVQIDNQRYLGSITNEEADQCMDVLKRVNELKDNEITLLQTLSRNIFNYVRPEKTTTDNGEAMEGQVTVDEVTGTAADLNKEKAMKGIEEYDVANVKVEPAPDPAVEKEE